LSTDSSSENKLKDSIKTKKMKKTDLRFAFNI